MDRGRAKKAGQPVGSSSYGQRGGKRRAKDRRDNGDNDDNDEDEVVMLTHRGRGGMVLPARINVDAKEAPRRKKERTVSSVHGAVVWC